MSGNSEEYVPHVQTYEFGQSGAPNQTALENAFRAVNDTENLHREIAERNSAGRYHYYGAPEESSYQGQNGSSTNNHNQFAHEHSRQYEGNAHQFQQAGGRMDGRNETYINHPASGPMGHNGPHDGHISNHPSSQHGHHNPQFQPNGSQSAAAVPIPAMALHVSNLSSNFGPGSMGSHLPGAPGLGAMNGDPSAPPKSRCIEEDFAIILQRSASAAAKSSNTKYRCLFCNFTFVGGPQKIRVHLTGKRENGTRLSRCENCPEEVRRKLEERMKAPKEAINDAGLYDDDVSDVVTLPPRNVEEQHVMVLSRSQSSNSKSSNTRYKCRYCRFKFVGGPQKIRVHLTGQQEGGTRMSKCPRVPEEVIIQMEHRRKAPKPDMLATPAGSASSSATGAGAGAAPGEGGGTSSTAQQQAYIIAQQQQALIKQQQQHAAQLQLQQQLHAQQQLQQQQHIQQLLHQQHAHLGAQPHLQHPLHGGMHPTAAQLHGGQLPLHLHPQHMLHLGQQLGQQTAAQLLMQQQQQQQQMRHHPHLAHHQQIPSHLLFPHGPGSPSTNSAQHAQLLQHQQAQQQSHLLHSAHSGLHPAAHLMHPAAQAHHGYDLHDEATAAVYHAELQQLQAAAAQAQAAAQSQQSPAAQAAPVSRSPTPTDSEEPAGAGPDVEGPSTTQAASAAGADAEASSGTARSAAAASLESSGASGVVAAEN